MDKSFGTSHLGLNHVKAVLTHVMSVHRKTLSWIAEIDQQESTLQLCIAINHGVSDAGHDN